MSGSCQFKIKCSKISDTDEDVISSPFFIGGYTWKLICCPYSKSLTGDTNNNSISVILCCDRKLQSVSVKYQLGLLDKIGRTLWLRKRSRIFSSVDRLEQCSRFVKKSDITKNYLKDGFFVIICMITIVPYPCLEMPREICSLQAQISKLLLDKNCKYKTSDVTFDVNGEKFPAHRLILAARSPVFEAELFGSMAESRMECIKIEYVEPVIFEALLHFIYTDSVPTIKNLTHANSGTFSTSMLQDLLVIADRYDVHGLITICEDKLCAEISLENVTGIIMLAEQHDFTKLKKVCLEFITNPTNLVTVLLSDEFIELMHTYPSLLIELRGKVADNLLDEHYWKS